MLTIQEIESFVGPDYAGRDVVHGLAHIHRVLRLARRMAESHEHDPDALTLGAYFHGTIYLKEPGIRSFMEASDLPSGLVDRVIQAAWESGTTADPQSIEGALLHDAHLLEGGKTFMVTKCLVAGTSRGQTVEESIRFMEQNVLGRFHCCLPESQAPYEERERFAREFLDDLKANL